MTSTDEPNDGSAADRICHAFKIDCEQGFSPEIQPLLEGAGGQRAELFCRLLQIQLETSSQRGEPISAEQIRTRYPEFTAEIESVMVARTHLIDTANPRQLEPTQGLESPQSNSSVKPPGRLGRYSIKRTLGEGAMGSVYLAHDAELDRQVALKIPKFVGDNNEDLIERFYREARAAATLHHRNICPVFDIGVIEDTRYISMAYIKGQTLSAYAKSDQPSTPAQSAQLVSKLARALSVAHEMGVVHRDLKPANIMIDPQGEPVVMDFGLARHANSSELTHSGAIMGTPSYMSPEQVAARNDEIGPQTDIYSLGVVLYQLLTGRLPFQGEVMSVLYQITHDEPIAPSKINAAVNEEMEAICLRMMAKDIPSRFATMGEVADAVEGILNDSSAQSHATTTILKTRGRKQPGRLWLVSMLITGAVAVAATVTLGVWALSGNQPSGVDQPHDSHAPDVAKGSELIQAPFNAEQAAETQRQWAKKLGVDVKQVNSIGIELMLIPPGRFRMGSLDAEVEEALAEAERLELSPNYIEYIESESPARDAIIDTPFYMGATEVTVAQFKRFVNATSYQTTAETDGRGGWGYKSQAYSETFDWRDPEFEQTERHPVVEITLADAEEFCEWISEVEGVKYRLPTENEWEFACRAGTNSAWSSGELPETLDDVAWYASNSGDTTHPVGSKSPNAFGLYDVHGNVREWCAAFASVSQTGVLRGGAFMKPPLLLRSAQRIGFRANSPYAYHGFRVIAEIKPLN